MTRSEAEKIMNEEIWNATYNAHTGGTWIRVFERLGILKLDEPENKRGNFWLELRKRRGTVVANDFGRLMDEFGVTIVEREK